MIARESEVPPARLSRFFGLGKILPENFCLLRFGWVSIPDQGWKHPNIRFALILSIGVVIDHLGRCERTWLTVVARWPRRPWVGVL